MMSSNPRETSLHGMRVLVVEDSFLSASSLREMLTGIGCLVVGPVSSVAQARQLLEREECDAAILDVNLGEETSIPIAEALASRQTPFFFVTGHSGSALLATGHQHRRRLLKLVTEAALRAAMLEDFIRDG